MASPDRPAFKSLDEAFAAKECAEAELSALYHRELCADYPHLAEEIADLSFDEALRLVYYAIPPDPSADRPRER